MRVLRAPSGRSGVAALLLRTVQACRSRAAGCRTTTVSPGRRFPQTRKTLSRHGRRTLTITDNRTGQDIRDLPIQDGTIRAMDLRQIKVDPDDFGMMTYDPAFTNTAACRSGITYIDGDRGILMYRGYPIEQLAEHSDYLETAYLILFGELPTASAARDTGRSDITRHTMLHENIKKFLEGFRYDAHPMGMFLSTVGALSTFYPDAKNIFDARVAAAADHPAHRQGAEHRRLRLRHTIGRPYVLPDNDLSFSGNFLNMLFKMTEPRYKPHPVLERALDVLFILHADHEQNCSTHAMRGDRQLARRSVFVAGRRGGGALRAAARRRERGRAARC